MSFLTGGVGKHQVSKLRYQLFPGIYKPPNCELMLTICHPFADVKAIHLLTYKRSAKDMRTLILRGVYSILRPLHLTLSKTYP